MTTFWSALVNGAIPGAVLSFAVCLALRAMPRRALNAATRYAVWWIVLLVTLALPLSYSAWRTGGDAVRLLPSRFTAARDPQWVDATSVPRASALYVISLPLRIPANRWLQPVLNFWIAASLFLLARVFVGYAALYRRGARATAAPPELARLVASASRRDIRLAVSGEIAIPMATGPLRPTVLLPESLLTRMNADDLEQIARHEAAHLARRDDCALFAQRIIEALFALHPVVRWLTRQIDLEREIACDDIVVGSTEHARSYAACLTRAVVLCGGIRTSLAAANVADSRSHLSRRVELLVDKGRSRSVGLLKRRFALIVVALICTAGLLAKAPLLVAFAVPHAVNSAPSPQAPQHPFIAQAQPPALPEPKNLPPTFGQQLRVALEQMKQRQFDEAIATFRSLIPEAPDDHSRGGLWVNIGEAYRYKDDLTAAIQAMEQAVALLPDDARAVTNLAVLYDAQYDFVHARQYYERALAIDPNNPLVLNNLAFMLSENGGDLDQALNYARTAQAKLPTFLEVDDTVGWIYLKKNMPSIAIAEFRKLLDAAPQNPEYHYHYALALNQQGDLADALEECKTALERNPKPDLGKQIRSLMDKIAPIMDTRPPRMFEAPEAPPK